MAIITNSLSQESQDWIAVKIKKIVAEKSTRDLFLAYSLLPSKITNVEPKYDSVTTELKSYLVGHKANTIELSRIYLLITVLESDSAFFTEKVANLIQIADKTELETFLKFLILLPNAVEYKHVGVEALRTNIGTVFNAIALNNHYPAKYFNEQQWNQMYLKAVFIESDLSQILSVDDRGNEDLSRIISDYAHERWAASRTINPLFWRPVTNHMNDVLLEDMKRLLASENEIENKVAALCCYHSNNTKANKLISDNASLVAQIKEGKITWKNI